MNKCFCDRCLQEIKSNSELRRITIANSGGHVYQHDDKSYSMCTIKADLCTKCASEIIAEFCEGLIHQD